MRPNVLDLYHGDNRELVPNFAAVKQNGIFAIIHKSTQGMNYVDKTYAARKGAALDAGLLWGAYHFLTHASNGADQAKFMLDTITPDANTMIACDFEKSAATPTLQQCMDFMSYIDANAPGNVSCVLYSGDLIRETLRPLHGGHQAQVMNGAEMFFAQHRLWLAEYGPHSNLPWPWSDHALSSMWRNPWLWQYSGSGRVNPVIGAVDLNYYPGEFYQLKSNWTTLTTPTPNPLII